VFDRLANSGDILGAGLNAGLRIDVTDRIKFGLSSILVEGNKVNRTEEKFRNGLTTGRTEYSYWYLAPVRMRAGLAYQSVPVTAAVDGGYTYWTGTKFYPDGQVTPEKINDIANTFDVQAGLEFLIPLPVKIMPGIKVRAGGRHSQLAYSGLETARGRNSVTGGLGFLFDRVLMLDLAGKYTATEFSQTESIGGVPTPEDKANRTKQAVLTVSYRF
jgi:hypothetical protein